MERARLAEEEEPREVILSNTENVVANAILDDLSEDKVSAFMDRAQLGDFHTPEGLRAIMQLGFLDAARNDKGGLIYTPTGLGLLLFGKKPQLVYPNAVIRATYKTEGKKVITPKLRYWYEKRLGRQIDRSEPGRKYLYDYPIDVINELVKNAILHRDYDIEGAPIYLEINDDAIIIKSPGYAVPPIKLGQIANFNAPSLSRNPKIMFVFDALDMAEQRGLGFMTVRELPEKYGLPLPLVSYEEPYLVFTLPRNAEAVKKVDNTLAELDVSELKILNFFKLNEGQSFSKSEVVNSLGISARTAERELKHLVDLQLLVRDGVGRGTVYCLARKTEKDAN